jgi:hypothetical protein
VGGLIMVNEFEREPTESQEPTIDELVEAVSELLSKEQLDELKEWNVETALGLAFSFLIDVGIDDPEQFLIEKRILE